MTGWVDVGRRDVSLGSSALDLPAEPQLQLCIVDGCSLPGAHDGMCAAHFWNSSQDEFTCRMLDRMATAYVEVVRLVRVVQLKRAVSLRAAWQLLDQPRIVRAHMRALLLRASQYDGLVLEGAGQYWLTVTDRPAALRAIRTAALETRGWYRALAEAGLA